MHSVANSAHTQIAYNDNLEGTLGSYICDTAAFSTENSWTSHVISS